MDSLEKIDIFESLSQYITTKANKEEVKQVKLKAQHIEELIKELIIHIENMFDQEV